MNEPTCARCHNIKGKAIQNLEICGDCQRDEELDTELFLNEVDE